MPLVDRGVRRYASSSPRQDREDLKQTCALAIIESESDVNKALARGGDHAAKLVSKIVRNTLVNEFRRGQRPKRRAQVESLSDPQTFREASRVATSGRKSGISEAVTRLEPKQRMLADLLLDGYTVAEIRDQLGWSYRQFAHIKKKAAAHLKKLLEK